MPRPPIDVLVSAAASPDLEIAKEAQLLVSGLLRRWSRQIDDGRRISTITGQLAMLARSLDHRQAAFSSADHAWLAATTRRILRLANRTPIDDSPLVALHCDSVLASILASENATKAVIRHSLSSQRTPIVAAAAAPAGIPPDASSRTVVQPKLAAHVDARSELTNANPLRDATDSMPNDRGKALSPIEPGELSANLGPANEVSSAQADDTGPLGSFHSPWRGEWAHPVFRILPAMPIHGPSRDVEPGTPQEQSVPVSDQEFFSREADALANVDSRQLLARWLVASGGDVFPLEGELTRRGFGRLSARLVRQLFAEDVAERLRLVDDVLTEPGVDARPWLILLADDDAADVRLLAVTIMATSDDPVLIDKAWQVAINDRDPRIAGLAGRLRDRRDNAQRR